MSAAKRWYKGGTFVHERGEGRTPLVTAYTRYYRMDWPGCVEYEIEAASGEEAKRIAIRLRKWRSREMEKKHDSM